MRSIIQYLSESEKEVYRVPMKEKLKNKKMNPKTNRIKTFKTNKYLETNIKLEDRTLKNLPRYADGKPKVTFQQWLKIDAKKRNPSYDTTSYGWSPNDSCYGWSHRAIHGFKVGDVIKPGSIGNKYNGDENKKFEPYTIKTREEAEQHAIRFARDVS